MIITIITVVALIACAAAGFVAMFSALDGEDDGERVVGMLALAVFLLAIIALAANLAFGSAP